GPGLNDEQWERLTALATSLTAEQSIWVGGYFTGYAAAVRARAAEPAGAVEANAAPRVNEPPQPAVAQRTLTILYASETGTGMALAEQATAHAQKLGLAA